MAVSSSRSLAALSLSGGMGVAAGWSTTMPMAVRRPKGTRTRLPTGGSASERGHA
jgi:hypothetical protein